MNVFDTICWVTVLLFQIFVGSTPSISVHDQRHSALLSADQCDWIGSGGGGRGVRPVYLRCSRGTVLWRYPRGALRIVFSVPTATSGILAGTISDFNGIGSPDNGNFGVSNLRGCVKVSGPARVYLETNGKLRPIYSPKDGKHESSHRCFHANKRPTALYVEADEITSGYGKARLQYDLERKLDRGTSGETDEEAECRPCSMEELAAAYCQSDLVARGTVSAVQKRPGLDAAELILRITKTLRRVEESELNEVASDELYVRKDVRVRVSTACDARHGQGEFVIMAKRRLGDLTLVCAPRLETWAKTVQESRSAPCVLKS